MACQYLPILFSPTYNSVVVLLIVVVVVVADVPTVFCSLLAAAQHMCSAACWLQHST